VTKEVALSPEAKLLWEEPRREARAQPVAEAERLALLVRALVAAHVVWAVMRTLAVQQRK
jgi:hypothetical protein